ncbi:hypothetical protein ACWDSD_30085 [Streptomyces spiralis]
MGEAEFVLASTAGALAAVLGGRPVWARDGFDCVGVGEAVSAQFHHPDHRLADEIEELADAC